MKNLVQDVLGKFGYGIRQLSKLKPFTPFVRSFSLSDTAFQMWIANEDDVWWYDHQHWEKRAELTSLRKLAKAGDRILEIGSHHGFTGMLLSRFVGDGGSVYSLEAHPQNTLIAHAQLGLNPAIKNLQFVNLAANSAPGTVSIRPLHNSSIAEKSEDTIQIPAVTGDQLDETHGPFNFLKIDVEGYELEVLQGCQKLLSRTPKLALEIHTEVIKGRGQTLDQLFEMIGISRYEGEMFLHTNDPYRPAEPFDPKMIPSASGANVFLRAK